MGWNQVHRHEASFSGAWESSPLKGIRQGEYMYFVHSYYFDTSRASAVTETGYILPFASSVCQGTVYGVQFHPEATVRA
jgi:glutamine amidotransferase